VTVVIRCESISKSYASSHTVGIKELLVRRRKQADSRFARKWALHDVSFAVNRGRAFGVIGANGSGKSTLLGILLGALRPETGTVVVDGRVASLLALGAGFHPDLTGRENVFLYGSILGMRIAEIRDRFDSIVSFSEIGNAVNNPLRTYSSGMITRLGFSTIVHTPADVLLIDEVLAVGDIRFQAKCQEFLADYKRRGTLVIVSHSLDSVQELCDEGIWLEQGRIACAGPIADVVAAYRTFSQHSPCAAAH
jgi:ABC-type polysaccharide/polyol phosphate transport system ATPase subunit